MRGLFITFEGQDGAGKSTQIGRLEQHLRERGIDYVITREPGGCPIAEKIRNILLDNENAEMDAVTEALLYAAARAQHVKQVIKPNILAGRCVICDRYFDSSVAYQGYGRELGAGYVEEINLRAMDGMIPTRTYLLMGAHDSLLERKTGQGLDRLETENGEFKARVHSGFMAMKSLERVLTLNAQEGISVLAEKIAADFDDLYGRIAGR